MGGGQSGSFSSSQPYTLVFFNSFCLLPLGIAILLPSFPPFLFQFLFRNWILLVRKRRPTTGLPRFEAEEREGREVSFMST